MRLWPKHWHLETWICSMRGHATPAADAATIGPDDAALGASLADGRRLARCLRCDTWIEHPIQIRLPRDGPRCPRRANCPSHEEASRYARPW